MKELFYNIYKSGHFGEALVSSIAWLLVSVISAYQSLALHFNVDLFETTTTAEYKEKMLIPISIFLCGFMIDFWLSIKNATLDEKKGDVIKVFLFLFMAFVFAFAGLMSFSAEYMQIICFFLVWMFISMIKGLSVIVNNDFEIPCVESVNNVVL